MKMLVKSKYGTGTYAGFFWASTFLTLIAVFAIKISRSEVVYNYPGPNLFIFLLFFTGLVLALVFTFKKSPTIKIDPDGVTIKRLFGKKKEIKIIDIEEIDLFNLDSLSYWSAIMTTIKLTHGQKITIIDPNYSNIGEMKIALIKYFPNKIKPFQAESVKVNSQEISASAITTFAGNPVFNFNNYLLLGMVVFLFLLLSMPNKASNTWLAALMVFLISYFITAMQSYRFVFETNVLAVKNYFFPWVNKKYTIENILAFNFEQRNLRMSQGLRITTKDFKSRFYSAGSLREKDWDKLKEYIKAMGIYFVE